jgi:hypothetical protein
MNYPHEIALEYRVKAVNTGGERLLSNTVAFMLLTGYSLLYRNPL